MADVTNNNDFNQTHFLHYILKVFGLLITVLGGILSWYLNSINKSLVELGKIVTEQNTVLSLTTAKIEVVGGEQKSLATAVEIMKDRLTRIEKEVQSNRSELAHHSMLISDRMNQYSREKRGSEK